MRSATISTAWAVLGLMFFTAAAHAQDAFTPPPIRVPDGYTVELAAAPPLVKHPLMACFDDRGRMYIAEAAGLNLKREDLEKQLPNFIRMIEDTDGDGRFDRSTIFADKMTFPQGCAWYDGALYVASSGAIWKLRDTDDDGVADERIELISKFGYNGNAADVHGCFISPDGRIYWVGGRHGHEVHDEAGNLISLSKAGGVFSCRPDGSDFRRHATGGFDNPVEIIFTDEGEIIGTVNIFEAPPRKDSLVHWVEGGVYPKQEMVNRFGEFTFTGSLLPPIMHFGHVAVSGLCRAPGTNDELFVTQFNTHEVVRVKLRREGSTFAAEVKPFFSANSVDFHCTDVLADADGSLLVIDTGGWFRIGCPTSQIAKPDVPGAIYRIRRIDAPRVEDPRELKIDWPGVPTAKLVEMLEDRRPAVREKAIFEISRRGDVNTCAATAKHSSAEVRRNAIWALGRIYTSDAEAAITAALQDADHGVRLAAVHVCVSRRIKAAADRLIALLSDDSAAIRREAATALGQIRHHPAVPALLKSLEAAGGDRMLHHALTYALMQIGEAKPLLAALDSPHAPVRLAAVMTLGQMKDSPMTPPQIAARFADSDSSVRDAAARMITRRRDWGDEAAQNVAVNLRQGGVDGDQLAAAKLVLDRPAVQQALAEALANATDDQRIAVLALMSDSGLPAAPPSWTAPIGAALRSDSPAVVIAAAAAAGKVAPQELNSTLESLAADSGGDPEVRLAAMAAQVAGAKSMPESMFDLLMQSLEPAALASQRAAALSILSRSRLSAPQLIHLAPIFAALSPLEIGPMVQAFGRSNDAAVGRAFAAALTASPARFAVRINELERAIPRYPTDVQALFDPLRAELRQQMDDQNARLNELERTLTTGDAERGKTLFFSKATCFVCHRVGDTGGLIGPDLTQIGRIRTRRDLVESIAFPSASFAREYDTRIITTRSGATHLGRIIRETQDTIYLLDAANQETPIPRKDVTKIETSTVSLMPPGLERLLTSEELSDLLAYLHSLK